MWDNSHRFFGSSADCAPFAISCEVHSHKSFKNLSGHRIPVLQQSVQIPSRWLELLQTSTVSSVLRGFYTFTDRRQPISLPNVNHSQPRNVNHVRLQIRNLKWKRFFNQFSGYWMFQNRQVGIMFFLGLVRVRVRPGLGQARMDVAVHITIKKTMNGIVRYLLSLTINGHCPVQNPVSNLTRHHQNHSCPFANDRAYIRSWARGWWIVKPTALLVHKSNNLVSKREFELKSLTSKWMFATVLLQW